jgi:hypothetical protein
MSRDIAKHIYLEKLKWPTIKTYRVYIFNSISSQKNRNDLLPLITMISSPTPTLCDDPSLTTFNHIVLPSIPTPTKTRNIILPPPWLKNLVIYLTSSFIHFSPTFISSLGIKQTSINCTRLTWNHFFALCIKPP